MNRTEIRERLVDVFQILFNADPATLTDDASPAQIAEWTSVQHLSLVMTVEEAFGISLNEEQIGEMLSFGLVVEVVHESLSTDAP